MNDLSLSDLSDITFFCDPASGKSEVVKRVRARSAIVGVAHDWLNRVFVLDVWADRCSTDALIDKIFAINAAWTPRIFGCEANGLQSLFGDAVLREARFAGVSLPLSPVLQPTRIDKDWRIRTGLQPVLASGRLFLQPSHEALVTEIRNFPMHPTKDLVDALETAIRLLPPVSSRRERDTEHEAYLTYLRDSGADRSVIDAAARGESLEARLGWDRLDTRTWR